MVTRIRPATVDDADGIARVHTWGWRQAYAGQLPADYLADRVVEPSSWRSRLTEPRLRSATYVGEVDGEIVGFAGVGPAMESTEPERTDLGQLLTLYVLADHLGRGVGHALHEAALQGLRTAGFSRAMLWVLASNRRAITFYRRQGWRAVEDWHDELIADFTAREQRFERDLEAQSSS